MSGKLITLALAPALAMVCMAAHAEGVQKAHTTIVGGKAMAFARLVSTMNSATALQKGDQLFVSASQVSCWTPSEFEGQAHCRLIAEDGAMVEVDGGKSGPLFNSLIGAGVYTDDILGRYINAALDVKCVIKSKAATPEERAVCKMSFYGMQAE